MKIDLSFLSYLVKRDIQDRYVGSIIGIGWTIILPLVYIGIYTVIFSRIMSLKLPDISSTYGYGFYLAAGIIPWTAFSSTIIRSSTIFLEKKPIISKIPVQLPVLPLSIAVTEGIILTISLTLLLAVILLAGLTINLLEVLIYIPLTVLFQQILAFGIGLLLATITVYIRDFKEIISILMQLWFWFTPIVYTLHILPESIKKLTVFNPAYSFIHVYQNVMVLGNQINTLLLIGLCIFSIISVIISYRFYKKLSRDIRDFL